MKVTLSVLVGYCIFVGMGSDPDAALESLELGEDEVTFEHVTINGDVCEDYDLLVDDPHAVVIRTPTGPLKPPTTFERDLERVAEFVRLCIVQEAGDVVLGHGDYPTLDKALAALDAGDLTGACTHLGKKRGSLAT